MSNPYQPPSQFSDRPYPPYPPPQGEGDATGGVIPYKNPYALTAYYLGLFGLICCITPIPAGLVPLVLGIIGLRKRAQNPAIKGSVHAWIGIVCGAISALFSTLIAISLIAAALSDR
jgi:hypothetical protein